MAGKTTSERVSVKGYLIPFLQEIGSHIGTEDLSEVVNHLLTCHKLGCFGLPQSPASTPVPQSQQSPGKLPQDVLDDDALIDGLSDLLAA
jgi:hypothetical protein